MPVRLTPPSVALPEMSVTVVPTEAPLSVKLTIWLVNAEPPEVRFAVSVAVPPDAPEPLTALIAVEALLGVDVVVEVGEVAPEVATSNASTHTQDPAEPALFVPVTSIARV